jgi:hypothetical protein
MLTSDVCHAMQHWKTYEKWNYSLFEEMEGAYVAGRLGADPSSTWYEEQLEFFDKLVIPVSQKLVYSQIFGASGQEKLDCAKENRNEWANRGHELIKETAHILTRTEL